MKDTLFDDESSAYVIDYLREKGIEVNDLAEMVYEIQKDYIVGLNIKDITFALNRVLGKREVLFPMITGIQLDKLCQSNKLDEPLQSIIKYDYGLYGVDETLALSMTNQYGTIALTSFGYLDKVKNGVAKMLDEKQKESKGKVVNTFLDDIVSAIVANASAFLAHNQQSMEER